jgi:hypothetical protein
VVRVISRRIGGASSCQSSRARGVQVRSYESPFGWAVPSQCTGPRSSRKVAAIGECRCAHRGIICAPWQRFRKGVCRRRP